MRLRSGTSLLLSNHGTGAAGEAAFESSALRLRLPMVNGGATVAPALGEAGAVWAPSGPSSSIGDGSLARSFPLHNDF
jgi:hypothetical protein